MSEQRTRYVGNQNAAKPYDEKNTKVLNIRCKADEIERWQETANRLGMSLSDWVRTNLNCVS